ncbi:MAG: CoA transferase, partial [Mariprofundus sp.]|nr:CoA transferase [Mariprofundus sp.]
MRYILTFTAMLMAFSPQLQAEGLLQWLDGKATSHQNHKEAIHADGAELVLDLIEHADVLVENFRPGTLEKWGLGPEVLHQLHPKLTILRVS